jgi:multiple antibiotic resistance protein
MAGSATTSFLGITVSVFLILNATGLIPLFLAILGRFDHAKQLKIIWRELTVALLILLAFTFCGDTILKLLGISRPIIGMAGGTLLFLISLTMVFPRHTKEDDLPMQEPVIVPLAIPIIAGPGAIATVMLYSHETGNAWLVAGAVITAWIPSCIIIFLGSFIKKLLGEKGLTAVERLGGMLVCLIGVQMLVSGALLVVQEYFHIGT